ncbi:restriction endonuclease [Rhodococcus zopfii]|uniref:restriction endonuclease n=1 Tax=Rhodococcus zopfii TaxID=43772 RepID=UPI000AE2F91C|nr:restriction endonuclease [Rhodococcus zopfii]
MTTSPAITVPVWQQFMRPVLEVLSDGVVRPRRQLRDETFAHMRLTESQLAEQLASGQPRAENRIGWAISDLVRAEAVSKPARAQFQITEAGRKLLQQYPNGFTEKDLQSIPAYRAYEPPTRATASVSPIVSAEDAELDPVEQMESGERRLHADVGVELIKRLRAQAPEFLEQSVLDLLVNMGYGGTEKLAQRLGGSGDGGVDGVIDQDALGLDRVYVQAKRYGQGNVVQRPEVQGFAGALQGVGATRGIFITTSSFSQGAIEFAKSISDSAGNTRIVLIDGERLARLMIKYGVGVQSVRTFTVVAVDEDYFE